MVLQLIIAAAAGALLAIVPMQKLMKEQKKIIYRMLFEIADKFVEIICDDNEERYKKKISMEDIEGLNTNAEIVCNMALQYNPEAAERIKGNVLKVIDKTLEDLQEKEKKR